MNSYIRQTVNRWYYLEVLKRLRENVERKRPAHASLLIRDFLANMNITVLPQPPYLPDLPPADFFSFPKLKSTLKGQRFQMIQEIVENSQMELCTIPKKAYQDCFQKWQRCWEQCISAGGEYFEGDKAHSVAGMSEKKYKKIVKTF
jgi:transposase